MNRQPGARTESIKENFLEYISSPIMRRARRLTTYSETFTGHFNMFDRKFLIPEKKALLRRLWNWLASGSDALLGRVPKEVLSDLSVLPTLENLLLYPPSMAASNARMVSNGRSIRGRVGFDRSGSAGTRSASMLYVNDQMESY